MAKKKKLSLEELLEQALVKDEDKPYAVPDNWVWTKLNILYNFIDYRGKTPEKTEYGVPLVTAKNVKQGYIDYSISEFISREEYLARQTRGISQKGDILITTEAPLGNVALADLDEFSAGQRLITLQKYPSVSGLCNPFYAFYMLSDYFQNDINNRKTGTTVAGIKAEKLKLVPIPLPPLSEQQRIVDTIESLFEKLDRAKELAQHAFDSFENRKSAILHKAFTGELTQKWREENGVDFERDWEEKKLKEVCKLTSGGTPSRTVPEYYIGNIFWIKTGEINWNYILDSEEKVTQEAIENSSAKIFPVGTVLVAMYGQGLTRGRAAILAIEAATNQAVCGLIPYGLLSNKFVYYFFMCNYWKFREKAVGGNQPNFSGKMIGEFEILLPPLPEQKEIVRILDNLLENEEKAKELCNVIDKIDHMKKAILARAFRGELGTNNPDEESALALLKEVLKEKI